MSLPVILRITLLGLGLATVDIGWFSHLASDWMSKRYSIFIGSETISPVSKVCESEFWPPVDIPQLVDQPCPIIMMEKYFVSVVSLCLGWTIFGGVLVALLFTKNDRKFGVKLWDNLFHILLAFLLLSASVVYIVDAAQIQDLFSAVKDLIEEVEATTPAPIPPIDFPKFDKFQQLLAVKVIAAVLGIIQSFFHLVLGITGVSRDWQNIQRILA